jgi:GNAT superfamily N-acetyltransferase
MAQRENQAEKNALSAEGLSAKNWKDLELLFGEKGACGGCWCMTPRLPGRQYGQLKGEGNKHLLKKLVDDREHLGILLYRNETPIGWCSVSPKDRLMAMKQGRHLKITPVENVWAIVCLFIRKDCRRAGLSTAIIQKACEYAFRNGAEVVEAYPVVGKADKMPDVFAWNGLSQSYERAGFRVVHQLSATRLIVSLSKP